MSKTNGEIKIEKGVQIPPRGQTGKGRWQKLIRSIKVKDSFVIGVATYPSIFTAAKNCDVAITCRISDDKKTMRIWRIK